MSKINLTIKVDKQIDVELPIFFYCKNNDAYYKYYCIEDKIYVNNIIIDKDYVPIRKFKVLCHKEEISLKLSDKYHDKISAQRYYKGIAEIKKYL